MTDAGRKYDELSELQKRLLREVAKGRSSKEMSPQFGLEPRTIDNYLYRAGKLLGFSDRQTAAAAFVAHEAAMSIRCQLTPAPLAKSPETNQRDSRRTVRSFLRMLQPPPLGGREHAFTVKDRLVASFKVAGLGFAVILTISMIITSLFWAFPKT